MRETKAGLGRARKKMAKKSGRLLTEHVTCVPSERRLGNLFPPSATGGLHAGKVNLPAESEQKKRFTLSTQRPTRGPLLTTCADEDNEAEDGETEK